MEMEEKFGVLFVRNVRARVNSRSGFNKELRLELIK